MKRLPPTLYLLTSLATLFVGAGASPRHFAAMYDLFHEAAKSSVRGAVADAILSFATPVIFFLAAASATRTKDASKRATWISVAAVPVILIPLIHYGQGWKLYAEAVGSLISLVFALWPLVSKSPVIVAIAAGIYAFTQGADFYFWFWNYWNFGGSPSHLLLQTTAPALVVGSMVVAIASHFVTRKALSVQANS